jgi:hypothetical protein
MRRAALVLLMGLLAIIAACRRGHPASEAECAALLDRLVDLELEERGYRDAAISARWHDLARTRFRGELEACRGRALPAGALDCLARASSTEQAAHQCFR